MKSYGIGLESKKNTPMYSYLYIGVFFHKDKPNFSKISTTILSTTDSSAS